MSDFVARLARDIILSMPWYIFALFTPLFYSINNLVDKFLLEKRIRDPLALTALSGFMTGVIGVLLGFFTGFQQIGVIQIILMVFSGFLLILYLIPYFEAMKIDDASRVIPLFQFIPVFTFILSAIFLKETLNIRQVFGLVLVVGAGILISLKKIDGSIFAPRKSLWLMLLSSLMYGSIAVLFRFVSRESNLWVAVSYQYIGTGLGSILLILLPRVRHGFTIRLNEIKKSLRVIVMSHSLGLLAQLSESIAVTLVAVPLVHIIWSIQPVLVLIFGTVLTIWFPHIIKEDITKAVVVHKLVSVALMLCGLFLVYF